MAITLNNSNFYFKITKIKEIDIKMFIIYKILEFFQLKYVKKGLS
jgi:hypothetical protein